MQAHSNPLDNHLLASLDTVDWLRLQPHLEHVNLNRYDSVYGAGNSISHAYFPTTMVASLMHVTKDGSCAESALVGNDGMLGVCLFMSGAPSVGYASVLATGEAYRVPAGIIKREFERAGATMRVLLRYTQALLMQTAQHAICARHHLVTQQVAFCLLVQADRTQGDAVLMTQEQIATRIGVRREGVTEGAGHLQKLGLIRYSRGHIEILDREGLEEQACECYSVQKDEYQRLLPAASCQSCLMAA